jgi:hypothetical protein
MKSVLTIALILISFIGLGQKKRSCYDMPTVYHPKTQNQKTIQDARSDEFGNEYKEKVFQGAGEDTTLLKKSMIDDELLKNEIIDSYIEIPSMQSKDDKTEDDEQNDGRRRRRRRR